MRKTLATSLILALASITTVSVASARTVIIKHDRGFHHHRDFHRHFHHHRGDRTVIIKHR